MLRNWFAKICCDIHVNTKWLNIKPFLFQYNGSIIFATPENKRITDSESKAIRLKICRKFNCLLSFWELLLVGVNLNTSFILSVTVVTPD